MAIDRMWKSTVVVVVVVVVAEERKQKDGKKRINQFVLVVVEVMNLISSLFYLLI